MEAYNIWMVQSPLNFKLTFHLAKEIKFLQHVLENDFESAWDSSCSLDRLEDLTEFSTANGLNPAKIMHRPAFFSLFGCLCTRGLFFQIVGTLLLIRTASCNFCHILLSVC